MVGRPTYTDFQILLISHLRHTSGLPIVQITDHPAVAKTDRRKEWKTQQIRYVLKEYGSGRLQEFITRYCFNHSITATQLDDHIGTFIREANEEQDQRRSDKGKNAQKEVQTQGDDNGEPSRAPPSQHQDQRELLKEALDTYPAFQNRDRDEMIGLHDILKRTHRQSSPPCPVAGHLQQQRHLLPPMQGPRSNTNPVFLRQKPLQHQQPPVCHSCNQELHQWPSQTPSSVSAVYPHLAQNICVCPVHPATPEQPYITYQVPNPRFRPSQALAQHHHQRQEQQGQNLPSQTHSELRTKYPDLTSSKPASRDLTTWLMDDAPLSHGLKTPLDICSPPASSSPLQPRAKRPACTSSSVLRSSSARPAASLRPRRSVVASLSQLRRQHLRHLQGRVSSLVSGSSSDFPNLPPLPPGLELPPSSHQPRAKRNHGSGAVVSAHEDVGPVALQDVVPISGTPAPDASRQSRGASPPDKESRPRQTESVGPGIGIGIDVEMDMDPLPSAVGKEKGKGKQKEKCTS